MNNDKYTYKGIQFRKDSAKDTELLERLEKIAVDNDRSFTYTIKDLLWKALK